MTYWILIVHPVKKKNNDFEQIKYQLGKIFMEVTYGPQGRARKAWNRLFGSRKKGNSDLKDYPAIAIRKPSTSLYFENIHHLIWI
jgi:hypothetical protein